MMMASIISLGKIHMIGMVIISHGALAEEMRNAIHHVMGPQENLEVIGIEPDDDVDARRLELQEAVARVNDGSGVIILSDMFGGTPSNLAISLLSQNQVEVIAGFNLPMLIKLVSIRGSVPIAQAINDAEDAAKKYINVASKLLAANG